MADDNSRRKWNPHAGPYLGEVSSLAFLNLPQHVSSIPYLLAGSGSDILLYDLSSGELIRSFQVFEGVRVHGTVCSTSFVRSAERYTYKLVIFGEKKVKIFSLIVELASSSGEISVNLEIFDSLPRLSNWVFDVCFLQDSTGSLEEEEDKLLAIGCSDNSLCIWNVKESLMAFEIQSPERCLLYTMRLWGNSISTLRIASGTIFNEILVWRVVGLDGDSVDHGHYCASHMLRLTGHEGSIFRIVWSLDGSKLVSVSDDRSARIWEIDSQEVVGPVLFGHSVRVWDCCISDSLIVTAGEDCTCRVWGVDGTQLEVIKEHIGRGIWRCLYDPNSSLLVTAGFDSAIKVHQLHKCGSKTFLDTVGVLNSPDKVEYFSACLPNSAEHTGLMDSKSEYVRCLQFTQEDTMYVATNHGCLYHARLLSSGNVRWTELVCIPEGGPIITMDVMPSGEVRESSTLDDWVALGDGKGYMTIVRVIGDIDNPHAGMNQSWKASPERQLLGAFWCKSLGYRFVFSCNPRGLLKLWKLSDPLESGAGTYDVSLLAEFSSCFEKRIMCVDASVEDEVILCGDLRGNITLFPLSKDMLNGVSVSSELKIPSLIYFKGAHGISTVSSLSVARITSNKAEICSTGADGCICYFEYDRERQTLEFMGLKQLKELNLVQSVCQGVQCSKDHPNTNYAAGFASTDFILWNLTAEAKVAQISCGGWRRPHSFYLGEVPERQNCFAYVKDDVIHIHRHWIGGQKTKVFPLNLHTQFHGRELHSVCFISADTKTGSDSEEHKISDRSSWIATGCEGGSVRLTRYASEFGNWSTSELLGEHVGGSAVRSVCCVSNVRMIVSDIPNLPDVCEQDSAVDDSESPCLLISVGAKRVLTSWLLRNGRQNKKGESCISDNGHIEASSEVSSVTFQWLATDMPTKSRLCGKIEKSPKLEGVEVDTSANVTKLGSNTYHGRESYEDDWRYMAATAFLVKCVGSRLTICFVAVACSDATLTLRALVLPHRLWFDVASLVPLKSPVLSLQHAVVPLHPPHEGNTSSSDVYVLISGATDGSIAFWDVTKCVEAFVKQVSSIHIEKFIDCQLRPRTGRGSQGGRKWKLLKGNNISKKPQDSSNSVGEAAEEDPATSLEFTNGVPHENDKNEGEGDSPPEISEIKPSHVVKNAHQSGVNCLHVSRWSSSPSDGDGMMFNVISGGDDQALHCLSFNILSTSSPANKSEIIDKNQNPKYGIRLTDRGGIASAHSSAIKGVWMDANWVFSTGLDQRVRCWFLEKDGKLIEHAHIVVSVPEPEALDAKAIDEKRYQIAIAGRGIQMVEFSG
ncbi:PREDICTED: WD repeat-containing protein 6-like isoform X1 [Camelina sativa]|uniref:WD repeat-containing protein 6-like isoform X1 n=1 Tax=Camelina sativa TaxID=90675 RepID=A0ABM0TNA3_CAMSA|nr:PREDICTED: WD repeat-containing protein 6-like isoform X1 [Camelina sativa]